MKINRETYKSEKPRDAESYLKDGYMIDFEVSWDYENECQEWYCYMYRGDSNAPWKTGTVSGEGEGVNLVESFYDCIDNLQVVISWERV